MQFDGAPSQPSDLPPGASRNCHRGLQKEIEYAICNIIITLLSKLILNMVVKW